MCRRNINKIFNVGIFNRICIFLFIGLGTCINGYSQDDILDSVDIEMYRSMYNAPFYVRQQIDMTEEKVTKLIDRQPSFAVYRDSYFVTGVPLNKKITNNTADATFQLSIRQRLTKSVLPFNTFLYLTYTQKTFWNLYSESSPFRDTNYNPGLGLGKYIIHNNKLVGSAFLQIKHESNGRDSLESRSWNYISFAGKYFFNMRLSVDFELRAAYVDGGENKDLLKYRGYGVFSVDYIDRNDRIWLSADINPRRHFGSANVNLNLGLKISKRSNQYLYAQFYSGYAENLLDYKQYSCYFRLGFCIKPDFYSIY